VLQCILWLLFSSVLNTYCYYSTDLVLQRIVWLLFSSVLNTYSYCSIDLVLQWIVWLLCVLFSIYTAIAHIIWCYSELCDCYSVQFSIPTLIAWQFSVKVNCVTFIYFSSQYILLFLKSFFVTVNCVTLILFSSQYVLLFLKFVVLHWIMWPLFCSVLSTYSYSSNHFVLQWTILLFFSSVLITYHYF